MPRPHRWRGHVETYTQRFDWSPKLTENYPKLFSDNIVNGLSDKVGSLNLEEEIEPDENAGLTQGDELRQRKAQRPARQARSASSTAKR